MTGECDYVPIAQAAEALSMHRETLLRMIRDDRLGGWVDWSEIEAKLLPVRRPHR